MWTLQVGRTARVRRRLAPLPAQHPAAEQTAHRHREDGDQRQPQRPVHMGQRGAGERPDRDVADRPDRRPERAPPHEPAQRHPHGAGDDRRERLHDRHEPHRHQGPRTATGQECLRPRPALDPHPPAHPAAAQRRSGRSAEAVADQLAGQRTGHHGNHEQQRGAPRRHQSGGDQDDEITGHQQTDEDTGLQHEKSVRREHDRERGQAGQRGDLFVRPRHQIAPHVGSPSPPAVPVVATL